MPGHPGTAPYATTLSTLAPARGISSPVHTNSPTRKFEEEELQVPDTPEMFEAVKELIESMVPPPQTRERALEVEAPVLRKHVLPSKGSLR